MREQRLFSFVLALVLFMAAGIAGCGGGGGGTVGPPPPPPQKTVTSVTLTCAPATLQLVASGTQPTSQCNATVNYSDGTSGTASSLVTFTASPSAAGTVSAAGLFTPSTAIASQTQVTVTATSTENAAKSGTATITVNPIQVAPTITLSASTATVAFGGTASFTFTKTGTPDPTAACTVTGTGTCSVSGTTVSYTVPNPASPPASFQATLMVTVQSSAGSASATVTINLVSFIASATVHGSVDPQAAFCARYNCAIVVDIVGTGFFAGTTEFLQDLVAPVNGTLNAAVSVIDSSHATMTALVGKGDFNPKPWHFGTRQPGTCCGFDSNVINFVFLGNLDTMDVSTTDAFQITNLPGIGIQKFKLADGSLDGNINLGAQTIAVDDKTQNEVISEIGNPGSFIVLDANGAIVGGSGASQITLAVAAKGGYLCGSEDLAGQIVSLPVTSNGPPFGTLIVGNTPWQTAMLTLNGQLNCVVYNIGDLVFTVAPIPIPSVNPAPLWTLTVTGLTPLSQIPGTVANGNIMPNGGWPLVASQSANKAAILSRFDRKAAIIDLLAKAQMKIGSAQALTVDLAPSIGNAVILQMAVDNTHQKAVISLAQTATETSTFISVDLNTGAVSPMNAKTPFYATDLRVSVDGATLYVGGFILDPITGLLTPKFLGVANN